MSEPRSFFFATPPPLPSPALPLTGPRAPTKAHPFFAVAANAARVPAPSPIRPSARRDPYPHYHTAHAQPQIRRAVQQRLSNTLTLLPPITRSEPFHSTLSVQHNSTAPTLKTPASATLNPRSVSELLNTPFGLALLDSRITTKHKKPTPSPVALGIQAISLKAAIFRFIKPESQYGNRRLFLVTDRSSVQQNYSSSVIPLLLCEYWEMDQQLPVLASICDSNGGLIPAPEVGYRFTGMIKREDTSGIDVGGVNGGCFEFELDSPDVGVPDTFYNPEQQQPAKRDYQFVDGIVFQCFQIPSKLQFDFE
ncbi:hypothetical protein HDU79_006582 [Rhizoclosmatium sp. JEL0117]|nr:hypothetical protein HDU79_006582 [Rhizoclosmatium sp. JEL0117]